MSHHYYILCEKCGQRGEYGNYMESGLIRAVKDFYPIWLASEMAWFVEDIESDNLPPGTIRFLLNHFGHGDFLVCSEYANVGDPASEAKYPSKRVQPTMPEGMQYNHVVLTNLITEAKKVRDDLAELLVKMDKEEEEKHAVQLTKP